MGINIVSIVLTTIVVVVTMVGVWVFVSCINKLYKK